MSGDEPQLGGEHGRITGQEPELSHQRPHCPNCGKALRRVKGRVTVIGFQVNDGPWWLYECPCKIQPIAGFNVGRWRPPTGYY